MNIAFLHLHWGGGTYKGKQYKSYSLARSVRKNGKNNHKSEIKLGKLTHDEVMWWKKLLHLLKNPSSIITTMEDIITRRHYSYCELAVVNKFWNYWKLDNAFPSERDSDIPLAAIAKILTVNRCVIPESKSAVAKWFKRTSLPEMMNTTPDKINKSRIFRELKHIAGNKENICNHLLAEYEKKSGRGLNKVYYDLSSTTFSGTKCIISKYGHCKEGFQTHVVLALLVTEDGLPFYWEVLPGGTADAKTVEWLLEKCGNKFKDLNITAVFDRGFVSNENLARFETAEIKYISAMDKNQVAAICGDQIKFEKFSAFTPENIEERIKKEGVFTEMNSTTYHKEIKVEHGRRYILCFNPQLFIDQRNARENSIKLFENEIIPELNEELARAQKSRARDTTADKFRKLMAKCKISAFTEVELKALTIKRNGRETSTFQGGIRVDSDKLRTVSQMDGFWMLTTNLSEKDAEDKFIVSSEDALRPYREKVIIEDAFRDIKSFIEIAPVYVWLENHIKAHYTICVLAYLINRTITNLLKNNKGELSEDIKTHIGVYRELQECSVDEIYVRNLERNNYCVTELTEKQKEILNRLGAAGLANVNGLLKKFRDFSRNSN